MATIDSFRQFTDRILGVDSSRQEITNQLDALVARTRKGTICSNQADSYYIRLIQSVLKQAGYGTILAPYGIDGDYGPKTQNAVTRFQADRGLPTNGCVDTRTAQAMRSSVAQSGTFINDLLTLGSQYLSYQAYEELPEQYKTGGQQPGGNQAPVVQPQDRGISNQTLIIGGVAVFVAAILLLGGSGGADSGSTKK